MDKVFSMKTMEVDSGEWAAKNAFFSLSAGGGLDMHRHSLSMVDARFHRCHHLNGDL